MPVAIDARLGGERPRYSPGAVAEAGPADGPGSRLRIPDDVAPPGPVAPARIPDEVPASAPRGPARMPEDVAAPGPDAAAPIPDAVSVPGAGFRLLAFGAPFTSRDNTRSGSIRSRIHFG